MFFKRLEKKKMYIIVRISMKKGGFPTLKSRSPIKKS